MAFNGNSGKTYARTLNEEHRDHAATTTPQHRRRPRTDAVSVAAYRGARIPPNPPLDFPATPRPATPYNSFRFDFIFRLFFFFGCCMRLDTKYLVVAEIVQVHLKPCFCMDSRVWVVKKRNV